MRLFLLLLLPLLLLSAVQIGAAAAAKAPAAAPAASNLTDLMSRKGCRTFADLLLSTGDAAKTFQDSVAGGLSVFCPADQAMKAFLPTFKNLSADDKLSLLLYHAVPVYYSADSLKTNNGVMNTLATDGTAKNYNFTLQNDGEHVAIQPTAAPAAPARITATILDRDPLAVYVVDEVLQPREIFKPVAAPAPAPAPATAAAAPKKAKPAGPDAAPADQKVADQNAAHRVPSGRWLTAAAAVALAAAAFAVAA
ncbi:fasciclin-like arabinogalactan protein 1 [Ananas comosus]|uniref:Fasciclin-like arabinogalactan protein 1 n=1 Tax=Ananas comosus TaxID=4615 RepID=A0A6P5F0Y4_ANACO|nr:fasciclin-like arabinogalactan protein 1 [Ananas comosus]